MAKTIATSHNGCYALANDMGDCLGLVSESLLENALPFESSCVIHGYAFN